jgi:hypothetical protein
MVFLDLNELFGPQNNPAGLSGNAIPPALFLLSPAVGLLGRFDREVLEFEYLAQLSLALPAKAPRCIT